MKIGILITGHPPDALRTAHGDYGAVFARFLAGKGLSFESWAVVDGVFPESVDAADGWLVTGSRHGAYDPLPWIPRLEAFIREIVAAGRPLIGVCFGHQIIAQALGGQVAKAGGGWIAGHQTYRWGDAEIPLHAWHQDQVITPPPGATVLATGPGCPYAALAIGDHVLTVQPHPEYDTGMVRTLVETRGPDVMDPATLAATRDSLGPPVAQAEMAARFARFFRAAAPATAAHG